MFLGFKNVKLSVFGKKICFRAFFIKLKCACLRTGPGDFKTPHIWNLTLNAPITKKSFVFSSAEMFKKPLWQTGAVCSRSTLFASILNSSVMLGNYLQQTF